MIDLVGWYIGQSVVREYKGHGVDGVYVGNSWLGAVTWCRGGPFATLALDRDTKGSSVAHESLRIIEEKFASVSFEGDDN